MGEAGKKDKRGLEGGREKRVADKAEVETKGSHNGWGWREDCRGSQERAQGRIWWDVGHWFSMTKRPSIMFLEA